MDFTETFNLIIFLGIVFVQVLSLVLLFIIISRSFREDFPKLTSYIKDKAFLLAFLTAFFATLGSLIYSDVLGYEPCTFCWFGRIFMYPQVVILGLALWKKDFNASIYAITLSCIGALIALYQYLGEFGFSPLPCATDIATVSCAVRYVTGFGYITIPMMALTVFIFIFLALMVSKRNN